MLQVRLEGLVSVQTLYLWVPVCALANVFSEKEKSQNTQAEASRIYCTKLDN